MDKTTQLKMRKNLYLSTVKKQELSSTEKDQENEETKNIRAKKKNQTTTFVTT